jgi:hypothetical protein
MQFSTPENGPFQAEEEGWPTGFRPSSARCDQFPASVHAVGRSASEVVGVRAGGHFEDGVADAADDLLIP